jgi:hypothetical protein
VLIREQKQDGAAEEKASSEEALLQDYGSRFVALLKYIRQVRAEDPTAQFLVFSEWSLELQKHALLLQKLANITTAEVKGTTSHCQHSIAMFKEKKIDVILLSLHTMGLEVRSGLLQLLDIVDAPVMRMWNIVHLSSKLLSPAAEAFRYFMLEQGEAHLLAHDTPLIGRPRG